ncbi:hypothetical protein ACFL6L_02170 [candidate division KSB1 bacterium]
MDWKSIGESVIKKAPLIGKAVSGGMFTDVVAAALGADHDPQSISDAVKNDPDAYVKLKDLESKYTVELQEISLQLDKARLQDKRDVREREYEMARIGKSNWPLYSLGALIAFGFFAALTIIIFKGLPEGENNNLLMLMVGGLISNFTAVVSYFFGSSKGSAEKNALLKK